VGVSFPQERGRYGRGGELAIGEDLYQTGGKESGGSKEKGEGEGKAPHGGKKRMTYQAGR